MATVEKKYYVYAYLREDGSPYYVGKGKGGRAYSKYHNVYVPTEDRIQFIANHLTNEEANNFEKLLIAKLGRKDLGTGILRNKAPGGEGGDNSLYIDYVSIGRKRSATISDPMWIETVGKERARKQGLSVSKTQNDPVWIETIGKAKAEKISRKTKNIPKSKKTKDRMKLAKLKDGAERGRKQSKTKSNVEWLEENTQICEYCGYKSSNPGAFKRWHGEKCKQKK